MSNTTDTTITSGATGETVAVGDISASGVEAVVLARAAGSGTPLISVPVSVLPTSGVASVSGTAPITSTGGANPNIGITAATTSAAGSMSAADKTKLDSITAASKIFSATVPGGGSVPANSGTTLSVTVTGVLATDAVFANQTSALFPAGMSITNAFASGANTVTLEILNCTTTSKTVPSNFPLRVGVLR